MSTKLFKQLKLLITYFHFSISLLNIKFLSLLWKETVEILCYICAYKKH